MNDTNKTAGMRLVRSIDASDSDDEEEQSTWDWYKQRVPEGSRTARLPVLFEIHVGDAVRQTDGILGGLKLPDELRAVRVAANLHDQGKLRPQFQFLLGNRDFPRVALAKSGKARAKPRKPTATSSARSLTRERRESSGYCRPICRTLSCT